MRTHLPLLIGAMLLLTGCTASDTSAVSEAGETQDAAVLEDGMTVGGVLYVLNEASTRTQIGEEPAANGTFLVLQMGVQNTRDDTATIAADQFTVAAGSTTYRIGDHATTALRTAGEGNVLDRQRIDPDFQTQTVLAFDIPVQETYTLTITQNGEAARVAVTP